MHCLRIAAAVSVALAGSLACSRLAPPPASTPTPQIDWQTPVAAMAALRPASTPQHLLQPKPQFQGGEFDPNQYFTALTHLSMQPGYALDYVYIYDTLGGFPLLYARPESVDSQTFRADPAGTAGPGSYLDYVSTDGSQAGFYELVVLRRMAGQFYLYWHASYNDTQIVAGEAALEAILTGVQACGAPLDESAAPAARALDLQPQVAMGSQAVTVSVVTFSKWGGFSRETLRLNRAFPHTVLDSQSEVLVEYDCGIVF